MVYCPCGVLWFHSSVGFHSSKRVILQALLLPTTPWPVPETVSKGRESELATLSDGAMDTAGRATDLEGGPHTRQLSCVMAGGGGGGT